MKKTATILLILLLTQAIWSQESGRQYERYNILNKNLISTVFTNGGVIGHPVDKGPRGAWLDENNGYLGDVSPFVGCEIPYKVSPDSTFYFHSVTYCLADRRPNRQDGVEFGTFWGFRPKDGYFNDSKSGPAVAIVTDPNTWPEQWPDRMTDPLDPGWKGQWNGYFGKGISNATEETYFAMDDNNDTEFNRDTQNQWVNVEFEPDSTNEDRNGMALELKVRALQWRQFLAQDVIFWLYEITNEGTTLYNKSVFGMLVGTYVGVTGEDGSPQEYDDDWSFFDAELDITYTGDYPDNNDRNPLWNGPVGMVGYAFLESPGNSLDGIDNDNDADDNGVFTDAPFFEENDFDSVLINTGDQVVLIDNEFNRTLVTINHDTTVVSMGQSFHIIPDSTKLVEGNVLKDAQRREFVNRNAIDGIDNDLDGVIDENYFLHYYQRREDPLTGEILINKLRPLRHVNYISGAGLNDDMLDESRDDNIDNNGDWDPEYDDVGLDGREGTGDFGEGDGMPTSGADYGLPGEPHIDVTDVRESDQIGLTSFDYFTNADAPPDILENDELWWTRVTPGNFDVPASIVNNEPVQGEDGDFFYGSAFFPLRPGDTQRLSLALVYGGGRGGRSKDLEDLLKNRKTVQKIYNSNYQFPKEPETPTLTAEVGDGKVVLYWDRLAESSFDPVLRAYDFEGYRLYKSTDPRFKDVFTVTDVDGRVRGYEALEQWDLVNGIKGIFAGSAELTEAANGYDWLLGNDTGLRHYYVDKDVQNGRRYFYALTAYDRGESEEDIFPAESPFIVTVLPSGEIETGQNTVMVIPGTEVAGYTSTAPSGELTHLAGPADGTVSYQVVNEKVVTGNTYFIDFLDTSTDGIDNDNDWFAAEDDLNGNGKPDPDEPNVDTNDPDEFWPRATFYRVLDNEVYSESFYIGDTTFVQLQRQNLVDSTVIVKDESDAVVPAGAYILDAQKGKIRTNTQDPQGGMAIDANYTITYQYHPVYNSIYIGEIQEDPDEGTVYDTDIFDGIQLSFKNYTQIALIDTASGWNRPTGVDFTLSTLEINISPELTIKGQRSPNNFRLDFFDTAVDSALDTLGVPNIPVNFRIFNETLQKFVKFTLDYKGNIHDLPNGYYELVPFDAILFFEEGVGNKLTYTWYLQFSGESFDIQPGDRLDLHVTKPFRKGDEFLLTTTKPTVDQTLATSQLDRIRVVPNPYVVAHAHEAPLPPTITSGRGERKISFTHLPRNSTIHIFTARGEHVITINPKEVSAFNGTASWNLKTKENLDIAYGVYFYVVKSPVGDKKGKIAIIK